MGRLQLLFGFNQAGPPVIGSGSPATLHRSLSGLARVHALTFGMCGFPASTLGFVVENMLWFACPE